MNKGPMSRLVKVPVKCRTCGKIKYNVVCENQISEEKTKETANENKKSQEPKEIEQKAPEKIMEKKYKKPKEYSYINAVVNKQRQIARSAYSKEDE